MNVFYNSEATTIPAHGSAGEPLAFHSKLSGYIGSPLIDSPELASMLDVRQVLIKDESSRFGLPAFKILGASWAIYRALEARLGRSREPWNDLSEVAERVDPLRPITLVAATDGNHGRAVAHMAAALDFACRIYVPAGTAQARIEGIESEGADVVVINGTYDEAVARSAKDAGPQCLVISDTSWPGYEEVPRWVMDGYSTIMAEVDEELAERGEEQPDLIAVQVGVGALAAAVVRHYKVAGRARQPKILSVEPERAACLKASMEASSIVSVPGPHDSIMAGLNCGRPSLIAWPILQSGTDVLVAINDDAARRAMRGLAKLRIVAGETGAAGLAGIFELLTGVDCGAHRKRLGISRSSSVMVFLTEGATDPESYERIVGA